MKYLSITLSILCTLLLAACGNSKPALQNNPLPSLKQTFAGDFEIGTALNADQIEEKDTAAARLVPQQFNVATPENIMKAEIIHPEWDHYDFRLADQMIDYGRRNNIQINGHTLIWHSQLPKFAQQIQSADSFRRFFDEHIKTVAGRYQGKIYSWDVVNEALNEDGSLRNSIFLQKLGPGYIVDAFRQAAEASPGTELYYNDYNNEQPAKREGCIKIIKEIQAAGVRIDGVGIQGHWHAGKVPFEDIEASILAYASLGLKVMITELDLEVLPRNFQGADISAKMKSDPSLNPYSAGLPDSVQQQLASDYARLFELFLKHKDKITRITFWGVNDGQSWLNGWPVPGRTNYPLLFDRNFQPKPAFFSVIKTKENTSTSKKAF